MSRVALVLLSLLLTALLSACASLPPSMNDGVTFVLVRHAEKATDDPEDPALSEAGRARAQRLAAQLAQAPVTAIHVTEYRRTAQTAQPTADAHHVTLTRYYARGPAAEIAAQWRRDHHRGTVLIVGHSNTIPDLVSALSGQPAPPMSDEEYGRLTRVHIAPDGAVRVEVSRY